MRGEAPPRPTLPEPVRIALDEFSGRFGLDVHLWATQNRGGRVQVYPDERAAEPAPLSTAVVRTVTPRNGPRMELEVRTPAGAGAESGSDAEAVASVLHSVLDRTYAFAHEISFFTNELSERYEEINLLYSISEILGSILRLDEAARVILGEVCDVLGARRGSLWGLPPRASRPPLNSVSGRGGSGRSSQCRRSGRGDRPGLPGGAREDSRARWQRRTHFVPWGGCRARDVPICAHPVHAAGG